MGQHDQIAIERRGASWAVRHNGSVLGYAAVAGTRDGKRSLNKAKLEGKSFHCLKVVGPDGAVDLVERAAAAAKK